MSYVLNVKIINDKVTDYYQNFTSHHDGDSGIDLVNSKDEPVHALDVGTIDFGIQCEMRDSNNNLVSYYLYPRSSISKTTFIMANSVGIIDAGYRGNIMAKVRNMSLETRFVWNKEKLFQICSPDLKPIKLVIVESLSETSRGDGGFGSTNKS